MLLTGLNCKICVDEIVWWRADEVNLLNILGKIFGRLEDAGLFDATHRVCSSIPRSRGVERYTQGDRCLATGSV